MAAGLGSRYGGNKQIEGVGPNNEILMEYAVYDAIRVGFDKVVFVIKPGMEELMDRHPELMDGFHHKADLLLGTGRAQQALELLQSVAQRFSTNALYIYDLCRALGRVGKTQDALTCLEKHEALFDSPLSQQLFKKQKAVLLLELDRIREAMPLWQELYDTYGDRQAGLALVTDALYTGQWETVCTVADEMLSYGVEDEAHYMCLFHKAMARKYQGDRQLENEAWQAAAAEYDLLEGQKLLPKLRTLRVNIRIELGRYDDARKDLTYLKERLQKADPEQSRDALEKLGEMENIINQKQNAFN
jgi:tetratricopeptide (TPR) repeat protein